MSSGLAIKYVICPSLVASFYTCLHGLEKQHITQAIYQANDEITLFVFSFLFCHSLSAIPLGLIVIPGDSDLETCRVQIEKLQEVKRQSEKDGRQQRVRAGWMEL